MELIVYISFSYIDSIITTEMLTLSFKDSLPKIPKWRKGCKRWLLLWKY